MYFVSLAKNQLVPCVKFSEIVKIAKWYQSKKLMMIRNPNSENIYHGKPVKFEHYKKPLVLWLIFYSISSDLGLFYFSA